MSEDKAIVAVQDGETALAEPKKIALPQKRRCYVTIKSYPGRNSGPHRDQPMLDVSLAERTEDDLSSMVLWQEKLHYYYHDVDIGFATTIVLMATYLTLSKTLFLNDMWVLISIFASVIIGILTGLLTMKPFERLGQRRHDRALRGRLTEQQQIMAGVEQIAAPASGQAKQELEVPIESIFLALDHPQKLARKTAAKLVRKIPTHMQVQAVGNYRQQLTPRALRLIPGMEYLTPTRAKAERIGRNIKLEPFYEDKDCAAQEWDLAKGHDENDEPLLLTE
jgi:hypothetical protein